MTATKSPLTARQLDVYRTIVDLIAETGVPPSIREIGVAIGTKNTNAVVSHLVPLVKKGWLAAPNVKGNARGYAPPELLERFRGAATEFLTENRP